MKKLLILFALCFLSAASLFSASYIGERVLGGPYTVNNSAGSVWVNLPLDTQLTTGQRLALGSGSASWLSSNVSVSHIGAEYQVSIPFLANTTEEDRQGYVYVELQGSEEGQYYTIDTYYTDIFQFRNSESNSFQWVMDILPNDCTFTISAGTYTGQLVIQDKSNITIVGAGIGQTIMESVGYGPAVKFINCSNVTLKNMTITGGSYVTGSGVYVSGIWGCGYANLENCLVTGNKSRETYNGGMPTGTTISGAAFYVADYGKLSVTSSYAYGNTPFRRGVGCTAYVEEYGSIKFEACTLTQTPPTIMWSNNYAGIGEFSFKNSIITYPNANLTHGSYKYCCSYSSNVNLPGSTNIRTSNPMFVDEANHNYALQKYSPCIGKGYLSADFDDPNTAGEDQNLLGPLDETQDMGAVPYDGDRYAIYSFTNDTAGNWDCFPVLDDHSQVTVGGTTYTADVMRAFFRQYEGSPSQLSSESFTSYDGTHPFGPYTHTPINYNTWHQMKSYLGYKGVFSQNTSLNRLHGYHVPYGTSVPVPEERTETWVGYFLPITQTPQQAFGSYMDELYYIQTKNWAMARQKPKRGVKWIATVNQGQNNRTLSYGDMVVVKRFEPTTGHTNIDSFTWNYTQAVPVSIPASTSFFSYQTEPDYTPVFVDLSDSSRATRSLPQELALMADGQCYGAAVVEGDVVMIPAYIATLPAGAELELVAWDGSRDAARSLRFNLYNSQADAFVNAGSIVKDDSDYYQLRIGNGNSVEDDNQQALVPYNASVGNYPNPFNPSTTISYTVPTAGLVKLGVYNIKGQLVKTLVSTNQAAGNYSINWKASDINGKKLPSGLYFTRLQTSGKTLTKKMLLLK